jgi:hypothetical protein
MERFLSLALGRDRLGAYAANVVAPSRSLVSIVFIDDGRYDL